jgi:hypothetical protein
MGRGEQISRQNVPFVATCLTIIFTGRTTTGMIVSSIIASIDRSDDPLQMALEQEDSSEAQLNSSVNLDDISEETIYKRGSSERADGKAEHTDEKNAKISRRIQDGSSARLCPAPWTRGEIDRRSSRRCDFRSSEPSRSRIRVSLDRTAFAMQPITDKTPRSAATSSK